MINKNNLADLLTNLGFIEIDQVYQKSFLGLDAILKVDFKNQVIIYPEDNGQRPVLLLKIILDSRH
jgi:hypothetical protein